MYLRYWCLALACYAEEISPGWPYFLFTINDYAMPSTDSTYLAVADQSRYAYSSGQGAPPSCDCAKTGESESECSQFDCNCVCDLTAGVCDHNCCCDPECSSAQHDRFDALGRCLHQGSADVESRCYSTKEVDRVNPKFPLTARGLASDSIDRMLCVRYDNSKSRGKFYNDPGLQSKDFDQTEYDYARWKQRLLASHATDQIYDYGDLMDVAYQDPALTSLFEDIEHVSILGFLPLPVSTQLGECSESGQAQYLMSEKRKCLRTIRPNQLETACEDGFLDINRVSHRILVGIHADASPARSNWVQIAIRSMTWQDFETGEEYQQLGSCQTIYDGADVTTNSPTENASLVLANSQTSTCESHMGSARPAAPACRNALTRIIYTILHGDNIFSAYADIVFTDISSVVLNINNQIVLEQEYSIHFESARSIPRSKSFANYVNRSRSGNPGYIFGRPVVAGTRFGRPLVTDAESPSLVHARVHGLQILGSDSDGSCSQTAVNQVTLPFGVGLSSGCTLKLNRTELQDFCVGRGPHAAGSAAPRYFNVSNIFNGETRIPIELVGSYGNADPLDISQWLEIEVKPTAGNIAAWQSRTATCENAVTSMNYGFLWSYVGAKASPQARILAARLEFGTSDLKYELGIGEQMQMFPITVTASFVQHKGEVDVNTLPSPPVAISVPYDVWYPFRIDSSACLSAASGPLCVLVLTALMVLFW